jgi:hypothetical protein
LQVHHDTKLALNRRMKSEQVNRKEKGDNETMRQSDNQDNQDNDCISAPDRKQTSLHQHEC